MASTPTLTTSSGAPGGDYEQAAIFGSMGRLFFQDTSFLEKIAHFDHEVIPERRVHARGAGAHGYFEVTQDVTKYTKAAFLNKVGKKTNVFVRFSTGVGERGASEAIREHRGFAIKFYTDEGNYDMVGINMPVFPIRDAIKFPDLIHSQKRHPQTNVPDNDTMWDFWSLCPETTHHVTILFTDRGTPSSYRLMNGYSLHTFKWINAEGKGVWVKMHFKPEDGVKSFTAKETAKAHQDPDYATRDLFHHIESGKAAVWKAFVQVMPLEDAKTYRWDPFDATKVWPHKDYPLIEYGRLVLDRNPTNYHAEVEQSAFSPGNLVPGIEPSMDGILQTRLFSYPDAQRHRLGNNFNQIPINCPLFSKVYNYQRDGVTFGDNGGSGPNYWPNSVPGAPAPSKTSSKQIPFEGSAFGGHISTDYTEDDFEQARELYRSVLSPTDRKNLISNLSNSLNEVKREEIKIRAIKNFYMVDSDLGKSLAADCNVNLSKLKI